MKGNSISYYTGFSILRIWMCFEVVLSHCWVQGGTLNWLFLQFTTYEGIAVPVFMLMSFLLVDIKQLSVQNERISARLERLLIPHFFWTFAYFVIYRLLNIMDVETCRGGVMRQLLTGTGPLNATMWYQVDLIIITILTVVIFKCLSPRYAIACIWGLGSVALFMQYSGMNIAIFENSTYAIQYSMGRLCEMMPYVTIGILLCYFNILRRYEKNRICIIISCLFGIYFISNYSVFTKLEGYGYQGAYYIVMAILLISLFYYFPFNMLPDKLCHIINQTSKYTLGIYCMHRCVMTVLDSYVFPKSNIQVNSFLECVIVFILSFIISFIGSKIPIKWIQRAFV